MLIEISYNYEFIDDYYEESRDPLDKGLCVNRHLVFADNVVMGEINEIYPRGSTERESMYCTLNDAGIGEIEVGGAEKPEDYIPEISKTLREAEDLGILLDR